MQAARQRADREHAAAEAARVEGRFPVRRARTFGQVGGMFVLDGWMFEDSLAITDSITPAATVPQRLTLGCRAVVYG